MSRSKKEPEGEGPPDYYDVVFALPLPEDERVSPEKKNRFYTIGVAYQHPDSLKLSVSIAMLPVNFKGDELRLTLFPKWRETKKKEG